jgi:hypothetical protein
MKRGLILTVMLACVLALGFAEGTAEKVEDAIQGVTGQGTTLSYTYR